MLGANSPDSDLHDSQYATPRLDRSGGLRDFKEDPKGLGCLERMVARRRVFLEYVSNFDILAARCDGGGGGPRYPGDARPDVLVFSFLNPAVSLIRQISFVELGAPSLPPKFEKRRSIRRIPRRTRY